MSVWVDAVDLSKPRRTDSDILDELNLSPPALCSAFSCPSLDLSKVPLVCKRIKNVQLSADNNG